MKRALKNAVQYYIQVPEECCLQLHSHDSLLKEGPGCHSYDHRRAHPNPDHPMSDTWATDVSLKEGRGGYGLCADLAGTMDLCSSLPGKQTVNRAEAMAENYLLIGVKPDVDGLGYYVFLFLFLGYYVALISSDH